MDKTRSDMKDKRLEILQKVAEGTITPEQAHNELWDLSSVSNSFAWHEVEEFGRKSFYDGREVERYNEHGLAIFKRPTWNDYMRELDSK
jgi:hypothetical protein